MRWFLGVVCALLLTAPAASQAVTGGLMGGGGGGGSSGNNCGTVPTEAASAGLNTCTFNASNFTTANFDSTGSQGPGYALYMNDCLGAVPDPTNNFVVGDGTLSVGQSAGTISAISWASTAGGQTTITITGTSWGATLATGAVVTITGTVSTGGTGAGYNGAFTVASVTSGTVVVVTQLSASSPGTYVSGGVILGALQHSVASASCVGGVSSPTTWHGTAFGGAFYVEEKATVVSSTHGTVSNSWPSMWMKSLERNTGEAQWPGQTTGYVDYAEFDFPFEYFQVGNGDTGTQYRVSTHNWYGINSVSDTTPSSIKITAPTLGVPHVYGVLYIPATGSTGGTCGSINLYVDDVLQGTVPWTWSL